jgi:hypothetical protein
LTVLTVRCAPGMGRSNASYRQGGQRLPLGNLPQAFRPLAPARCESMAEVGPARVSSTSTGGCRRSSDEVLPPQVPDGSLPAGKRPAKPTGSGFLLTGPPGSRTARGPGQTAQDKPFRRTAEARPSWRRSARRSWQRWRDSPSAHRGGRPTWPRVRHLSTRSGRLPR